MLKNDNIYAKYEKRIRFIWYGIAIVFISSLIFTRSFTDEQNDLINLILTPIFFIIVTIWIILIIKKKQNS